MMAGSPASSRGSARSPARCEPPRAGSAASTPPGSDASNTKSFIPHSSSVGTSRNFDSDRRGVAHDVVAGVGRRQRDRLHELQHRDAVGGRVVGRRGTSARTSAGSGVLRHAPLGRILAERVALRVISHAPEPRVAAEPQRPRQLLRRAAAGTHPCSTRRSASRGPGAGRRTPCRSSRPSRAAPASGSSVKPQVFEQRIPGRRCGSSASSRTAPAGGLSDSPQPMWSGTMQRYDSRSESTRLR